MSCRFWSRCLSVWIGMSHRILVFSFPTTFSGSTHQSLLWSRLYSANMALYTIQATLLCLSVYSVSASLLQPLIICAKVSACYLHNLLLGSCTLWLISCATALVLRAGSWAAIIRALVSALMSLLLSHWYVPAMSATSDNLCARPHSEASHTKL